MAERAGIHRTWLARLETGRGDPRLTDALALYEVLVREVPSLSLQWLLAGTEPRFSAENDDVDRREFVTKALLGAAGAGLIPSIDPLAAEPWERLGRALRQPGGVDQATVSHLEQAMTALESLEYELAPVALIGPVRGHLMEVVRLLESSPPSRARRDLLSIAGETAATAGWLMWDLDRPADVRAYWHVGLQAARDAGDRALVAFVLASVSFELRDRPAHRVQHLRGLERDASPRTKAWIYSTEAEAYALIGDERACLRALDRADSVLARLGDDRGTRRPRYDPFDENRMLGERGAALVKLASYESRRFRHRGIEARATLERALAAMFGQPRMVNSLRVSYARALAQLGEVDGATQAAHQALDGVAAMGVQTTLDSLRKVVYDLEPWRDSRAVRHLDERLAAIL